MKTRFKKWRKLEIAALAAGNRLWSAMERERLKVEENENAYHLI
ncbi:hypothetical protein A2U01_0066939, partial [Trifolium medium]|nr:hypothetical protein [Trifolium medium]